MLNPLTFSCGINVWITSFPWIIILASHPSKAHITSWFFISHIFFISGDVIVLQYQEIRLFPVIVDLQVVDKINSPFRFYGVLIFILVLNILLNIIRCTILYVIADSLLIYSFILGYTVTPTILLNLISGRRYIYW